MGEIIKRIAKKNAEIDSILISIHDSQDKALAAGFTELYELYEELAKEFETQKKSNSMVMILMNQIHAKTEQYAEEHGISYDFLSSCYGEEE